MITHEPVPKREKERRDSLLLVLLIILLGFLCILLTSGWALRFAPSWRLPANMGSNLDPNSIFLTSRPVNLLEPIDPAILTNPPWFEIFLTPGAIFSTSTPLPQPTLTPITPVILPSRTNTPIASPIASPTSTPTTVFIPNTPTRTPTPFIVVPTDTPSNTPIPQVDLQVTKDDGVGTYVPGLQVTYIVTIRNNGPSAVIGAVLTDTRPAQVLNWTWQCGKLTGGASGCDGDATNPATFTDTVNLPNGASIEYRVTVPVPASATGDLINTASIAAPPGYIETNPANNFATDIDFLEIDLQITKTNNATTYVPNISQQYVIVVSNLGPSGVTGATVTDNFPGDLTNITWTCSSVGGATCAVNGVGSINDAVNLPTGGSVTYVVDVTVVNAPGSTITNTATVSVPIGVIDPNPANNSASDTDTLIVADPPPPGLGTSPNNVVYKLPSGTSLILDVSVIANGDGAHDLVYYEYDSGGYVDFSMVRLEISDGRNWYTIFDWGDGSPDANTNLDYRILPPGNPGDPEEVDERQIPLTSFYNSTGVLIDIDARVPLGTYSWLRITAYPQPPDVDGGLKVDAIEVLP